MRSAVYLINTTTYAVCAGLLLRGYSRARQRLLLWSGLCFVGLALSNFLIYVDLVLLPQIDLYPLRLVTTTVAMLLLLYGLIWEGE